MKEGKVTPITEYRQVPFFLSRKGQISSTTLHTTHGAYNSGITLVDGVNCG